MENTIRNPADPSADSTLPPSSRTSERTDPRLQVQLTRLLIFSSMRETLPRARPAQITSEWLDLQERQIENMWREFSSYHERLCQQDGVELHDHQYFTDDIFGEAQNRYLEIYQILGGLRNSIAVHTTGNTSERSSFSALKRISVPEFAGEYREWPHFKDLFISLVGSQSNIPAVEKMVRLKEALKGQAASLIANLPATSENYTRAWDILVKRYENKRLIISAHLARIFNLNKLSSRSGLALFNIINTVTEALQALNALGEPTESWDSMVCYVIRSLLDTETLRLWELELGSENNPPTLSRFLDFLESIARATENTSSEQSPRVSPASESENENSEVQSLHIGGKSKGNSGPISLQCPCCNKDHPLGSECTQFLLMVPEARRKLVQRHHRCFNCLGPHNAMKCRSEKRCRKCAGKHHTLIHIDQAGGKPQFTTGTNHRSADSAGSTSKETALDSTSSQSR